LNLKPYFCTTGSDETFATINEWISDCMHTHPICASEEVIGNPGRILDLESPNKVTSRHTQKENTDSCR